MVDWFLKTTRVSPEGTSTGRLVAFLRRVSRASVLNLAVIGISGCFRVPPSPRTCDPTPTQAHSALAWGPAPIDTADVRGRVIDARNGKPLADAYVRFDPGNRTARTDDSGEFRLANLPGGSYRVWIRRIGHDEVRDSVRYGLSGLRLLAALAVPPFGDFACTIPQR